MSKRISNKKAKQSFCYLHKDAENKKYGIHCSIEYCLFDHFGLYVWHYPPCEGGWYVNLPIISLTVGGKLLATYHSNKEKIK